MIDVFLIGAAPGVGKTRVAGLYAADAIAHGRTPGYLKPAQTGRLDDARAVAAAAPGTVCATAYRFLAALPPGVAARIEHAGAGQHRPPARGGRGAPGDDRRRDHRGRRIARAARRRRTTYADLAVAVGLPLVIVTRPEIGTLSTVGLIVEAAAARGLQVAGIAINGCANKPSLVERTTRSELGRIATVLGSLPLEVVAG